VDYGLTQDTAPVQSEVTLTEAQHLSVDYTFDHVGEALSRTARNRFDRHDANLVHTLDFGQEDRHRLRSAVRLFSQTGDFAQDSVRWDESLRLRHTDRFETRYDTTVDAQDRAGEDQTFVRGSGAFRHRLFESLTTTGTLGASRLDGTQGFTSDRVFGDLAARYTKRIAPGLLGAGVSLAAERQEDSERGGFVSVLNQGFVFPDAAPIIIVRRGIVPASVVVRDATGTRVFMEGPDYRLDAFPDRVELRRVPGGAIGVDEPVLIDYDIGPEAASTTDTLSGSVSLRYDFTEGAAAGLGLYTSYRQTDQAIDSEGAALLTAQDAQVLIYGADYRRGHTTLSAEREHHDSTIAPFEAVRLLARYDRPLGRGSSLGLEARHEVLDYEDPDNQLMLTRLTGRWTQQVTDGLWLSLKLTVREEQDDRAGDTTGFDQYLEVRYRRRKVEVYGTIQNSFLDGDNVDNTLQTLSIGLRRSF
jgi:hypothetical protein